jgi:hypothetical protein
LQGEQDGPCGTVVVYKRCDEESDKEMKVPIPPDDSPSKSRKRKFGEDAEGDGSDHQAEAQAAGQREEIRTLLYPIFSQSWGQLI